jgi:hypothetical protein
MRDQITAILLLVLIAGSLGVGYFTGLSNRQVTTVTSTTTITSTKTITSTSGTFTARVYDVTFQQIPCAGDIVVPWAVTLSNQTIIEPANGTLPPNGAFEESNAPNSTTIVFSVVSGEYSFTLKPSAGWPSFNSGTGSGTVTVADVDVTIQLQALCHP